MVEFREVLLYRLLDLARFGDDGGLVFEGADCSGQVNVVEGGGESFGGASV